jgi:formylglycine-generating enzyme required for sulfatase activity
VYVLIFALAAGAVTTGLILFKRHRDRQQELEAQRRRARIATLKRKLQARRAAPTPPRRERIARAIRVRPRRRRTRPATWKGPCPPRSVRIRSRRRGLDYCIDRYEHPNRKGVLPATALDEAEAREKCREQGKRLCTRQEWVYACEGPRKRLYAYGRRYREGLCVTADAKGRRRAPQPAGSHPRCRTRRGLYDLNGNMAEWVAGGQLMGGSAAKPGTQTSCESDAGSGGTAYNGLRCCADPKR